MDPARLEEQRASLPAAIYTQLWENRWVEAVGDFLDPAVLAAAFTLPGPVLRAADGYLHTYVAALDVGIVKDATALTIGHREGDRTLLDYQMVWQGSRERPVDLARVGEECFELLRAFGGARLTFDPWQSKELAQRLTARGIDTEEFHFSTQSKMRLASTLLAAFNTGAIGLYEAPGLHAELSKLRVVDAGSGMWSFDHRPGEHDDRSVSLAMMLLAATTAPGAGTVETVVYAPDPYIDPVIRRDDMFLTGERYLDETGELRRLWRADPAAAGAVDGRGTQSEPEGSILMSKTADAIEITDMDADGNVPERTRPSTPRSTWTARSRRRTRRASAGSSRSSMMTS